MDVKKESETLDEHMSHKTHNICERGHGRTYTYVFMLRLCRLTISLRRVSERE